MLAPDFAADAAWRTFFRAPTIAWFHIATRNAARGVVCHNATGTYQLYAWDTLTNQLTQRTFSPRAVTLGAISADGETLYYLEDAQGGQIGHFFRVLFGGSAAFDLTPEWAAYTSFYITESHSGNFYGFMTANQHGFQMFVVDTQTGATPHLRYDSETFALGPFLAQDAEIAVIATTDHAPDGLNFALTSTLVRTGEALHTLLPTSGESLQPVGFAQRAADMRFLAVTRVNGWLRPLIWNARSGERLDLALGDLQGDFTPLDWSDDGEQVLLLQVLHGRHSLMTYRLKERQVVPLAGYRDWTVTQAMWQGDHLYTLAQTLVAPTCILRDGVPIVSLSVQEERDVWFEKQFYTDGVVTSTWGNQIEDAEVLVIYLHSDPQDVFGNLYHSPVWAWAAQAVAWVALNVRGSASFPQGSVIRGVDDVRDVVQYARQTSEKRLILMGAGMGGTLALLAAAHAPTLFAGVIVVSPILDFVRLYADHEDQRTDIEQLLGGSPDSASQAYYQASPLSQAEGITCPVLFIHERDNPQMVQADVDHYVQALAVGTLHTHEAGSISPEEVQAVALGWVAEVVNNPQA